VVAIPEAVVQTLTERVNGWVVGMEELDLVIVTDVV